MANAAVATYSGRSIMWARVRGLGTEPKNIKWGTSAVTASANPDVALFAPATETGVAGTSTMVSTTQLADTYQVVGTLTALVGAKTITEAVLSDTVTLSGTTTIATSSQSAGATTVTVTSGAALVGAGNFYIQVANEVELVTGGQGTNTLTVTRGQLGSAAAAHAIGVPVTVGGDGGANANAGVGGQTATVGAAQGGSIFAHVDFAGIALSVNDSITFTFKDTLT
jgi:hypothetical protein